MRLCFLKLYAFFYKNLLNRAIDHYRSIVIPCVLKSISVPKLLRISVLICNRSWQAMVASQCLQPDTAIVLIKKVGMLACFMRIIVIVLHRGPVTIYFNNPGSWLKLVHQLENPKNGQILLHSVLNYFAAK